MSNTPPTSRDVQNLTKAVEGITRELNKTRLAGARMPVEETIPEPPPLAVYFPAEKQSREEQLETCLEMTEVTLHNLLSIYPLREEVEKKLLEITRMINQLSRKKD